VKGLSATNEAANPERPLLPPKVGVSVSEATMSRMISDAPMVAMAR
jgi:hypothetical protein